jgi:hypothetical protein
MKDKAPKWAVREIENEFFENLTAKLVRGSDKGRVTLTRGECRTLLDLVRNRPEPSPTPRTITASKAKRFTQRVDRCCRLNNPLIFLDRRLLVLARNM